MCKEVRTPLSLSPGVNNIIHSLHLKKIPFVYLVFTGYTDVTEYIIKSAECAICLETPSLQEAEAIETAFLQNSNASLAVAPHDVVYIRCATCQLVHHLDCLVYGHFATLLDMKFWRGKPTNVGKVIITYLKHLSCLLPGHIVAVVHIGHFKKSATRSSQSSNCYIEAWKTLNLANSCSRWGICLEFYSKTGKT